MDAAAAPLDGGFGESQQAASGRDPGLVQSYAGTRTRSGHQLNLQGRIGRHIALRRIGVRFSRIAHLTADHPQQLNALSAHAFD